VYCWKEILAWLQEDTSWGQSSDGKNEGVSSACHDSGDSRVSTIEKEVADLQTHSMQNAAHIQKVVTELELNRRDMAEVLALLKGGKKAVGGPSEDKALPQTSVAHEVIGIRSHVHDGMQRNAGDGGGGTAVRRGHVQFPAVDTASRILETPPKSILQEANNYVVEGFHTPASTDAGAVIEKSTSMSRGSAYDGSYFRESSVGFTSALESLWTPTRI
jgi:hypothetical protein